MSRPVLIESTAKQWKLYQLVGVALIVLGMALVFIAIAAQSSRLIYAAVIVPVLGIVVTIYGRVMAWWYHG